MKRFDIKKTHEQLNRLGFYLDYQRKVNDTTDEYKFSKSKFYLRIMDYSDSRAKMTLYDEHLNELGECLMPDGETSLVLIIREFQLLGYLVE